MKHMVALLTAATLIVTTLLAAGAAIAQEAVTVEVKPTAQVIAAGQVLLVRVEVTCEPTLQVLEAHVSVQQGATFGQAGLGSVVCDGQAHTHKVRVSALDGHFSRGEAYVSAFVSLVDPSTGTIVQGQDARTVSVVGRPCR